MRRLKRLILCCFPFRQPLGWFPFCIVTNSNMSAIQGPLTIASEQKESHVITKSEETEQSKRQADGVPTDKSAITPETHRFDPDFTQSVINATGPKASPRMRKVMASLIRHVHDFARENEITVDEYMAGIEMASIRPSYRCSHADTSSSRV